MERARLNLKRSIGPGGRAGLVARLAHQGPRSGGLLQSFPPQPLVRLDGVVGRGGRHLAQVRLGTLQAESFPLGLKQSPQELSQNQ